MNLAHYLGSGIIVPSIYIENKNTDIQDRFTNYLLLSRAKFTNETNCSIEIVLNYNDEVPVKISENFFLFQAPLPISRIKSIHFKNEEQKISTNFNISAGTAFIPESLLKVSKEEDIKTIELEGIEYKQLEKNWTEYLRKYDQILGGFSSMKISKQDFQNYPTHYFSTLGNINNNFSKILAEQEINIENAFQFAFINEGKFRGFQNTIYSDIDFTEVQRYAEKDKVKLDIKNGIVQIENIPEHTQTYLVAILESYGKNKRKQIDSFVSDLLSGKFNEKKKEGLALIFGLNKGYKAFRNKYKTQNFEVNIKFKLNNKLDYYIIESIFQNVFNSINSISSFGYIDDWFIDNKIIETKSSNYVSYQMIDEVIVWKERVLEPLDKLLDRIAQKVRSWFPDFFDIKKNEVELIFRSELELFKDSIENRFKDELEKNKKIIEDLKNENLRKGELITHLKNQINETHLKRIPMKVDQKTLVSEESVMPYGSLFSEDTSISAEKKRAIELGRVKRPELNALAKEYKIKRITSFNIPQLIEEILKHEFRQ